jgi:hypothetical protein
LIAKIGTASFGTLIAPVLVALVLKLFDSPTPPPVPVVDSTAPEAKPALASIATPAPDGGKSKKSAVAEPDRSLAPPEFKPLFNGRDLSGWAGGDKRWSVDLPSQALVGKELAGTKGQLRTWIYTERKFSDFRLRLEYRAGPETDSGIALRVPATSNGEDRIEIRLLGEGRAVTTGTIMGRRAGKGQPNIKPSIPASLRPAGDWNVVEVEFRGPRLQMSINGRDIQDLRFDEHSDSANSKTSKRSVGDSGRIGLQSRIGRVEFRKIEIQELTPSAGGS